MNKIKNLITLLSLAGINLHCQSGTSKKNSQESKSVENIVLRKPLAILNDDFMKSFEITTKDNNTTIVILLHKSDEDWSGRYYYGNVLPKKYIPISGTIQTMGHFKLTSEDESDFFEGEMDSDWTAKGTWRNTLSGLTKPFSWKLKPENPSPLKGTWYRNEPSNSGTLEIGNVEPTGFQVIMTLRDGGSMDNTTFFAEIKGAKAFVQDTITAPHCELVFDLTPDAILVNESNDIYTTCGFILSVKGRFERKKKEKEYSVRKYFATEVSHQAFKKRLGAKNYEYFASNFQRFPNVSIEPEDKTLITKAIHGYVNELYDSHASILCLNETGLFWAVFLQLDDNGKPTLYYYTNSEEHLRKMPKTIKNWRNAVSNVKYMSSVK
jgi:hypothetical protein